MILAGVFYAVPVWLSHFRCWRVCSALRRGAGVIAALIGGGFLTISLVLALGGVA